MSKILLRPSQQRILEALHNLDTDGDGEVTNTKLEIAREAEYLGSEQAAKQRVARMLRALEDAGVIERHYEPITGTFGIHIKAES